MNDGIAGKIIRAKSWEELGDTMELDELKGEVLAILNGIDGCTLERVGGVFRGQKWIELHGRFTFDELKRIADGGER